MQAEHDFELFDMVRTDHTPSPELLSLVNEVKWTDFAFYPAQKSFTFSIRRTGKQASNLDLCKHGNAIRRYINSRTEVCILDFIPNHECKKSAEHVVREVGAVCLVNQVRMALNGVLCQQIRGNIFELHAINTTPEIAPIYTRSITLKGAANSDAWHNHFAPTIIIGHLEPCTELHIDRIYMKPGRGFTDIPIAINGSDITMPPDSTHHMHNGLVQWELPDLISPTGEQLRDPMVSAPHMVRMTFHRQPFTDPTSILLQALQQLIDDLEHISTQVKLAKPTVDAGQIYRYEWITIQTNGHDLTCNLTGFDKCIGITIASAAGYLEPRTTHFTSQWVHITQKDAIIRISAPSPMDVFAAAIQLTIDRTASMSAQLKKWIVA